MFCGLGNFTLPIARLGATVVGVEGSEGLVRRGEAAAKANGLSERVSFRVANLFDASEASVAKLAPSRHPDCDGLPITGARLPARTLSLPPA